jgi:hypothetical protein
MYLTIDFSTFCDRFKLMERTENFSYAGLRYLFDYLESYEDDTGEKIELDVIALCCDYSEEPLEDVLENYRLEDLDELEDNTTVISFDPETGLVLYQNY